MLTDAQKTTLKAYIEADGTLNAHPNTSDGAFAIAAALNLTASPDYYVWATNVPVDQVKEAIDWTEFTSASISDAERHSFDFMMSNGVIDGSSSNVRAGIAEIFDNITTTRDAILDVCKRLALRIEQVFATGTGSQVEPATMGREGSISWQDVLAARNYGG